MRRKGSSPAPPPIFPRSGNSLFVLQTTCARQIYSPLSATAKICSLGRIRALNTDRLQCSSDYLLKKWDTEDFKLKRTAARFGANIIWLLVYLFVENPGLRGTPGYRGVVNTAVSRRPLRVCGDNLQRLKFLADLFRSRAEFTERSIFGAGGGIRCGNFAVIKGKHVKLKNFATPDLIIFILCINMSLDIFVIRRIIYYEIL